MFAVNLESVGEYKTTFSKFHSIVLWLFDVKVHDDMLPDTMMWREVDVVASKGEYPPSVGV